VEGPGAPGGDALVIAPDAAETTEPGGPAPVAGLVPQAQTDAQLLALWLFGRSPHTQRAYRREAARFLAHAGKPLRGVTLGDVQAFATALAAEAAALTPTSQAHALAAVKSLLAFGHRLGHLPFDVGGAVRLPRLRSALAERILSEADVHRLLAPEPDARNRALLRLADAGGLRVSELVALRWRDLRPRDDGEGQVTVYGKGGKTRAVLLLAQSLVRFTDQLFAINFTSACQALPPDRLRGRVSATVQVFTAGTAPAGALLRGALGEALGLRATAVAAGLGVAVAFLWLALSPVRSLRQLPDEPGAVPPAPAPAAGTTAAGAAVPDAGHPVAGRR
jgi:site-specific recombinase XerC